MNLTSITTKQQEIIKLLYKHRFLERKHIQQYFNHIDKRRSSRWLKDLKEKKFVDWIYDANSPDERSTPAIYFLDINGIRLLRSLDAYPEEELRKRYKDGARQQSFIDKCLLLVECALHLEARNKQCDGELRYEYALESDYSDPDSDFSFLEESEYLHPDLVFTKSMEAADEDVHQTYFVELFDITTPRYMIKKNIKGYVEYLASDEWGQSREDNELPIILVACPTLAEMIYAKRYARRQLEEMWDDNIPEEVVVRFSTIERVRARGVTAVIWEDV